MHEQEPVKSIDNEIPEDRWSHFIGLLSREISTATAELPTVRLWKETALISLISKIKRDHRAVLKTTFPLGNQILQRLETSRWIRKIPLTENHTGRTYYLMDHEAADDCLIEPEELLLAYLPSGVICYFSALQFYELTTQSLTFAHIARLTAGHPDEPPPDSTPPPDKNPLGTELFHLNDLPCYETKRYTRLTPGISLRIQNSRTWYRVTTLEQTLLDTLLQPERCGGEAVIFEAWEKAANLVDWDRMADHLKEISRPSLIRRVAVMLELADISLPRSSDLHRLLEQTRASLTGIEAPLPLLAGISYHHLHPFWKITHP